MSIMDPLDKIVVEGQVEYLKERGNQAPRRQPGDKFPIAGALLGIIAGVIIALAAGIPWMLIAGPIIGGIIGATLGSLLFNIIKKFQQPKNNLRYY